MDKTPPPPPPSSSPPPPPHHHPPPPLIRLPFAIDPFRSRLSRENTNILTRFLEHLIYNSTVPLSFGSYSEDIYTISLIRQHHDSCLFYIDTNSLTFNPDEPPFSLPFTSPLHATNTFRKTFTSPSYASHRSCLHNFSQKLLGEE